MKSLSTLKKYHSAITVVQSNSSLLVVAHDEHMTRVLGNIFRVPRRRAVRSNQSDDFEWTTRQNLQTSEGEWYKREYANAYRMDKSVYDLAMDQWVHWRE